MDPRQREILMNVPAHRSGPEMSFEEIRIRDYITAYQTTGHTPQPIPAEPANPAERARLGLPPLWVPYSEVNGVPVPLDMQTMQSIRSASRRSPSDHTAIPEVQVFASAPVLNEVGQPQYMQSIVCQHPFSAFSSEELRYQAYWIGKKYASEDVQTATSTSDTAAVNKPAPTVPAPTSNGIADVFQSITCQPQYTKHSFEELRLACYRTRHELTSEQIVQTRAL